MYESPLLQSEFSSASSSILVLLDQIFREYQCLKEMMPHLLLPPSSGTVGLKSFVIKDGSQFRYTTCSGSSSQSSTNGYPQYFMNPVSFDEEKQLSGPEPHQQQQQQLRKETNESKKSKESRSSTTGSTNKQHQLATILALFASVWGLMKRIFSTKPSLGRKRSTTDQTNQPTSMTGEKGMSGSAPAVPYPMPNSLNPNLVKNIDVSQSVSSRFSPDYPVVPTAVIASEADAQSVYAAHKQRLIASEDNGSWSTAAQRKATPTELRAQEIVWKLREYERDVTFGNMASEAIPGPETLDMGGQFLTNRERIVQRSKVYQIAENVPKGAHLHLHFNAELAPDSLIEQAKNNPNMHVRTTRPLLTEEDYELAEVVFNVLPNSTPSVDIWSPNYNPDFRTPGSTPWMLWSTFRAEFQKRRGVIPEAWIRTKLILSEDEVYGVNQTTNGIWARFNQATRCFKGLLNYESIYRWYCRAAIDNMVEDKVMYAELRPMLMDKFIPSDDGEKKLDHAYQMRMIIEAVQEKQEELKSKGLFEKFPFGVKIIYCAPRSIPKTMMRKEIADCIALKKEFPNLICGFDLVGAEDRPNHIGFYAEELLDMVKTCKELDLVIPFMFHAGESLLDTGGSKDPTKSNLYDAVLLNAKRVGHGFSLLKHPLLVEEFKRRKICIELCPTSNELLHLCRNIKEHPYPEILAAGIPCTINSDNPSLFSNSVSFEFYQILVGSPSMTIHGWKQLAWWSIEYSCLSEDDKAKAYSIFDTEWESFCAWVIKEFGAEADKLDIKL